MVLVNHWNSLCNLMELNLPHGSRTATGWPHSWVRSRRDGRTGVTSVEMTKQLFPPVCCQKRLRSQLCCYSKLDSDLETRVLEGLEFLTLCFAGSVPGPSPVQHQHPVQILEVSAIKGVQNCFLGHGQRGFSQVSVS